MDTPEVKNLDYASKMVQILLDKWLKGKSDAVTDNEEHGADLVMVRELQSLAYDLRDAFRSRSS